MLLCAKMAESEEEARKMLMENIKNGKGLESLRTLLRHKVGILAQLMIIANSLKQNM